MRRTTTVLAALLLGLLLTGAGCNQPDSNAPDPADATPTTRETTVPTDDPPPTDAR